MEEGLNAEDVYLNITQLSMSLISLFNFNYKASGGSLWDNLFRKKQLKSSLNMDSVRILFIDDNKFPIIDTLKEQGFTVSYVKDIRRLDDPKVVDSHIIFVDYKGVGKKLSDNEGVGVCHVLKERYGAGKYIVLSSAESIPNELISGIHSVADEMISKRKDAIEYIDIIERGISVLNHEIHS